MYSGKFGNESINFTNRLKICPYLSRLYYLIASPCITGKRDSWSHFEFDTNAIESKIFAFIQKSGELSGKLAALPIDQRTEMMIQIMVSEALKTSEIEGEYVSQLDILSSVRRNLGLESQYISKDKNAIGFIDMLLEAQTYANKMIQFTIAKWHFFSVFEHKLNPRQNKVIIRMLADGPDTFQGGMNVRKYVGITGTSLATASRDLQELVSLQVFKPLGSGRSARLYYGFFFYAFSHRVFLILPKILCKPKKLANYMLLYKPVSH
jgi:Fic family protein